MVCSDDEKAIKEWALSGEGRASVSFAAGTAIRTLLAFKRHHKSVSESRRFGFGDGQWQLRRI
ncbi:MAG: hypothetical protein U5M51_08150, partial [Emticicia sp.]|nr:hypothetical protein [Emticicia sp.]